MAPQAKKAGKKTCKKKHRTEFSKKLVVWALAMTTLCVLLSYVLSLFDHDGCQDVTVAVVTTCVAIAVGYEAKSFGEKNSRNKYGIDEDGNKIECGKTDEEALG